MTKTDHTEHAIAKLSERLTVELTAGLYGMTAEWVPELPERLTDAELQAYERKRGHTGPMHAPPPGLQRPPLPVTC